MKLFFTEDILKRRVSVSFSFHFLTQINDLTSTEQKFIDSHRACHGEKGLLDLSTSDVLKAERLN